MLNAEMLREQNSIIGYDLANELLSNNREASWSFKVPTLDNQNNKLCLIV